MERFGDYVRRVRIDKELTIADVATSLGFSPVHISDIERGKKNPPSQAKVKEWAQVLDLNPAELSRMAVMDVDMVKVDVSHDPQKAELAFAFARRLNTMSSKQRERLLEFLVKESEDE